MKIAILAAVIGLSFALTACSKDPKQDAATEPTAEASQAEVDDSTYTEDSSGEDTQPLDAAPLEDADGNVIEPASEPQAE